MIILDRNLISTELTVPELIYLQFLEMQEEDDYETLYKFQVIFGLDEDTHIADLS